MLGAHKWWLSVTYEFLIALDINDKAHKAQSDFKSDISHSFMPKTSVADAVYEV